MIPQDGQHDTEQILGLEQALGILRRRAPLIALCFILVAGAAFGFSKGQTKRYTATASLVFNNAQISQQVAGLPATSTVEPKVQQNTNVKLLELGATAAQTANRIGGGLTARQITNSLEITPEGESNVVDLAVTWTSPALAARIANTYAHEFLSDQLAANHRYFSSAQALVEKQLAALSPQQRVGPQGLALGDRAQSLAILAQLQAGDVQFAQAATVPTSPSSPKVTRNTILGAVLGLLLGVGLAFLIERLDRRIKEPEDLERIFKMPLLAAVPESQAYQRQSSRTREGGPAQLSWGELEVFSMLRARLRYFNVDRDLRLVLVTSAAAGDGKTTVVQNLAHAAADTGGRVLIIEGDLRRPTLAARLKLRRAPGLADVLISTSSMADAVQSVSMAESGYGTAAGQGSVSVLTAGAPPPNPTELIESHAMEQVLEWATGTFDLVLLDTSPLSVVPDAIPLMRRAQGVIVVSRLGKNSRDGAARMRRELTSLGAPMLGVVANGLKVRDSIGYGYGNDYYSAPASGYVPDGNGAGAAELVGAAVGEATSSTTTVPDVIRRRRFRRSSTGSSSHPSDHAHK